MPIYSSKHVETAAEAAAEGLIALVLRYPPGERSRFLRACRKRLLAEGGEFADVLQIPADEK